MLKSGDLIARKQTLRAKFSEIEAAIAEEVRRLENARLNLFIDSGRLLSTDGHRIDRFRREKASLLGIEKGLNRQIAVSRERERLAEAKKTENRVKKLEQDREKLRLKLLKSRKETNQLDGQIKRLSQSREELRQALGTKQLSKVELSFKLTGLKKFLSDHYICHPEKLEEAVRGAIEENREKFQPGLVRPMGFERSEVTQGFKLLLSLDSGVILKLEPFGPSVGLALHNPKLKAICLGQGGEG